MLGRRFLVRGGDRVFLHQLTDVINESKQGWVALIGSRLVGCLMEAGFLDGRCFRMVLEEIG